MKNLWLYEEEQAKLAKVARIAQISQTHLVRLFLNEIDEDDAEAIQARFPRPAKRSYRKPLAHTVGRQ